MTEREPSPELASKILSFEEFSGRDSIPEIPSLYAAKYNNFWCLFRGDYDHKKPEFYQRFQSENPNLDLKLRQLTRKINSQPGFLSDNLRPAEAELYEAYKMMRSYGIPDDLLFAPGRSTDSGD